MTTVQRVAQIFGIAFLVVAAAGFLAGGMSMDADPTSAPKALGLFPVNVLLSVVHLLFGIWGLAASRSWSGANSYCTISGGFYLVLLVLGFVAPTGFGLIPLGGNDPWLHLALGAPLLFFGLTARKDAIATNAV